ncbi:AbrB family trancriptional regulator fused to LRR containing domain [Prochlorococcus marinus subsp. marinus str. CCMP1375]|uniref:AbrB family trancriptional regulator fused to LRR containing domain n=6 Tax=Prochlorococcus TaxID=1218 RepID=Q7VCX4_PROMA|nr:AbrB family trancriptional regulator fused to LRR containing domain [Prochlorococcus marinus subsp. marinus str. CCMP1375]
MLKRLWSEYRNACLLTLTLLVIGIVASPWVLIIALMPIGWVLLMPKGPQLEQHPETIESSEEVESIEPLKGTTLLEKIKELGDVSKSDLVKACGYVSTKKDGGERLNFTAFYEALLEAKGVEITTSSSDSEEQREDSHQTNLSKSIEEALIRIISENIKEYGISDLQEIYDDSTQRSYDFSRLEGSYESTLYEWIHIYLKNTGLYNSFLNAKQLAQAEAVPEGTIYGPNDEEDENYEGIQEQIDELHWDCILVVAKEGIRQGLNIYGIPEYLENCGMDEYLEEINSIKVDKSNNGVADEVNSENSWEALDEDELIERLKGTEVPIDIIRKFVNSENWEIRRTIALREDLPLEIIEKLRNDDDDDVKDAVAYRQLPVEWRKLDDDEKIEKLKDDENVDDNIIEILSTSNNWGIRQAVAQSPSTTENILKILIHDDDDDVKKATKKALKAKEISYEYSINKDDNDKSIDDDEVGCIKKSQLPAELRSMSLSNIAKRINERGASKELLEVLSSTDNHELKCAIAENTSTSEEVLIKLIKESEVNWRENSCSDSVDDLARENLYRRKIPIEFRAMEEQAIIEALKQEDAEEEMLKTCAEYGPVYIRSAVAGNPKTPQETLGMLANDVNSGWVKEVVALNPNCSKETINRLLHDDDTHGILVRRAALLNGLPNDWIKLIQDEDIGEIRKRMINEHPSLKVINTLLKRDEEEFTSSYDNKQFSACVVYYPDTPDDILNHLRQDDDEYIKAAFRETTMPSDWVVMSDEERISALKSSDVPLEVFNTLALSPNYQIRLAIARSDKTSQPILDILANDSDSEVKEAIRQRELPEEWRELEQEELIKRFEEGLANEIILEFFSKSSDWHVRQAVAQNTSTPEKILTTLREDEDDDVKEAANKSLRILNPNSDAFGKERKSIYMKTEPGGRIAFSQLDQNQVNLLIQSISKMNLDEALDELRYSGVDAEGVVNSGDEGEYGNEGRIFFNEYLQRIGPDEDKETEKFKDGIYAVLMSLSKCSIEFEFELDEEFDNDKLEETCVPIRLPSEIKHGLYGHPDFNIITGFKYDGEEIEEDYEIIDRGYDDQFTIFSIKEGKTTVIYSNYNGDEEWNNSAEILNLM